MKKQQKVLIIISLIVVTLIVLANSGLFKNNLLVTSIPPGLDSDLGKCLGGWTTFSVDTVDVNSATGKIRVYGTAKGSECMRIVLSKDDLNAKLGGTGLTATSDVTIGNVKLLSASKTFPIDKTGNYYPSIEDHVLSNGLDPCRLIVWDSYKCCRDAGYDIIVKPFVTGVLGNDMHCITTGGNGLEGNFDSSRYYGDFDVLFDFNGEQYHLSRGQQSVNSANGKIHIEWTGNLENIDGVSVPGLDARLINSKFDLVKDGAYSEIQNKLSEFITCYNTADWSSRGYTNCKTSFDASSATILASKLAKYKTDNSALIYDADTDDNNLYVTLKATPFPTFILDLDATYFGIIALEGKPKITSCVQSQNNLISGKNKVVTFNVKNDATSNNVEFYGGVTCTTGVTGLFTNFHINSQEEKSISVELHPSNPNEQDLTGTCTINVNDLKSSNQDTCTFSFIVKYDSGIICTPNSLSCDETFTKVMKCTADGKNKMILETCKYGCELYGNGARCRGEVTPPPNGKCVDCDAFAISTLVGSFWKEKSCVAQDLIDTNPPFLHYPQSITTCIFSFLKYILMVFALIFGTLFGIDFLERFKSLRGEKNKIARIVVGFIMGILFAALIYYLFWVGVIVFIGFVIFKSLIKTVI